MKKILFLFGALLFSGIVFAQNEKSSDQPLPKVYNEQIDGMVQIEQAVAQARKEGKQVLLQVGGNWCPWCLRFADFAVKDSAIAAVIEKHYVYVHLNTSKANKNLKALQYLENPGRFGYPVFVILDENGKRLHTQNSAYLEEGKGYNEKKVVDFLLNWTKVAINTIK
mgnify:CR=1 FL=1